MLHSHSRAHPPPTTDRTQGPDHMKNIILAFAAAVAISGCTTTERDVGTGAALGAATGAAVSGNVQGAAVGAAAGAATGLLVRNLRNGYCQYRHPRTGRVYTARC